MSETTVLQPPAPQSSVEISRNSKGEAQFVVKVHAESVDEAMRLATEKFDALCRQYSKQEAAA